MTGCNPVHKIFFKHKKISERQDLNLRPLPPQGSALPSCATSRYFFMIFNFQYIGTCAATLLPLSNKTFSLVCSAECPDIILVTSGLERTTCYLSFEMTFSHFSLGRVKLATSRYFFMIFNFQYIGTCAATLLPLSNKTFSLVCSAECPDTIILP